MNELMLFPGTDVAVDTVGAQSIHITKLGDISPDAISLDYPVEIELVTGTVRAIAAVTTGGIACILRDSVEVKKHANISPYGAILRNAGHSQYNAVNNDKSHSTEPPKKDVELELEHVRGALANHPSQDQYRNIIGQLSSEVVKRHYAQEDQLISTLTPLAIEGAKVSIVAGAVLPNGDYVTLVNKAGGTGNRNHVRASYEDYALIIGNPIAEEAPRILQQLAGSQQIEVFRGSGTFLTSAIFTDDNGQLVILGLSRFEKTIDLVNVFGQQPFNDPLTQKQIRLLSGIQL